MAEKRARPTAVRFPEHLARELDRYVGRGRRSEFIIKATEKALVQLKQSRALKECEGLFASEDYPEFRTPEDTYAWVRRIRRESDRN